MPDVDAVIVSTPGYLHESIAVDAFAAGLMIGLLRGLPSDECLQLGSALGASCVRAIGTTPGVFTRVESEEFLRTNRLPIERIP